MDAKNPGPGRPAIGPRYEVRLPQQTADRLESYARTRRITTAEAMRDLITKALPAND